MNCGYYLSAHTYAYIALAVMSLFVFGLLLSRMFVRTPKGLIISSFISYVLVLISILNRSFDWRISETLSYPCFLVVMWPSFWVTACILILFEGGPAYFFLIKEWPSGAMWHILHNEFWGDMIVYLVAFSINTLFIFAIIRLILYIKHKVSAKKPQLPGTSESS